MSLTLLSLTPRAGADEAPCRRDGDRVSCTADGFKKLTDVAVQAKADAQSCEVRLEASRATAKTLDEGLAACRAALAAVPPCPPRPNAKVVLGGYGLGVFGALALAAGFVAPVPDGARLGLGLAGVGLVAGGAVLVWP